MTTHLFNLNIDFLFKSGTSRCGKRFARKHFALGTEDATCPECRRIIDERIKSDYQLANNPDIKARNPELVNTINAALSKLEPIRYKNATFLSGPSAVAP